MLRGGGTGCREDSWLGRFSGRSFAGGSGEVEAAVPCFSGIVAGRNEGRRAQLVFAVFLHQCVAGTSYPAAGARKSGRWNGRELPPGREWRTPRLECFASAARQ